MGFGISLRSSDIVSTYREPAEAEDPSPLQTVPMVSIWRPWHIYVNCWAIQALTLQLLSGSLLWCLYRQKSILIPWSWLKIYGMDWMWIKPQQIPHARWWQSGSFKSSFMESVTQLELADSFPWDLPYIPVLKVPGSRISCPLRVTTLCNQLLFLKII